MRTLAIFLIGILALGWFVSPAAGQQQQDNPVPVVIVVVGAGGTKEYAEQFADWAEVWKQACLKSNAQFTAIGLDKADVRPDRTRLKEILIGESRQTTAALWLVLIGHGTFDGRTAKFNLRGSDVSADDLAEWLKPMVRPLAVINTASSSAPFLKKLSAPERIVITATKSGFEQNFTRFGQYLADAIVEQQADLDKDGQTSLLEAFLIASHRVNEFYSAAGRLTTEYALIDDNADTLGTRADWFHGIRPIKKAADNASLDGYRAHQFHLLYSEIENKMPLDLRAKRDRLELEVMILRDSKEKLAEDEYFSKLEALLCDIARIYEQTSSIGTNYNPR